MDRLTSRQRDIVELRCGRELSVKEVAETLSVALSTVKNHSVDITRRLGVRSFYGVCRVYGEEHVVAGLRPDQV